MSDTGFSTQNGSEGGEHYTNGPMQNPVINQLPSQGLNVSQGSYPQMISTKAPHQLAPAQYNYVPPQNPPTVNMYQRPIQTNIARPPLDPFKQVLAHQDSSVSRLPPQPPSVTAPAMPSNNLYASSQILPPSNWHYGNSSSSSQLSNFQANHVTSWSGPARTPPLGMGYSKTSAQQNSIPGNRTTQSNYVPPGPNPVNPLVMQAYQPTRPPVGPPPMGIVSPPFQGPATSPAGPLSSVDPPIKQGSEHMPLPVDGTKVPNSFDTLESGGRNFVSAAPPPPTVAGRTATQSYPSLPPNYQNVGPASSASGMPPHIQPYPVGTQPFQQTLVSPAQLSSSLGNMSLNQAEQPEALKAINLLQERNILPRGLVTPPVPCLPHALQKFNCSPEVFRCTLTNIPQTQSLLNKAKLPLGLVLHPFKDLSQLPVVTSSTIVRCRSCRTYINPFVTFLDQRRWKCNLCYRVNDVPEEFMYNPVSRSYGEPHKRPEVQNSTIEFIAPSEYMLRPPQPAVYLFVLDVSHNAIETGYLDTVCRLLLDNLNLLPGDMRTKIGFITFDSTIHFYNLQEGLSQPQMLVVSDIEDVFIPAPDSLLVNLNESKELIQDLLKSLPQMFTKTLETQSALGPALTAAHKLLSPTGGRVSVFQTQIPSIGLGALKSREDPNQRAAAKDVQHLTPATDFYKKLALDCSGQQIAVDLFVLSGQYCDLASLACISRYSSGSVYYYPSYHHQHNAGQVERFEKDVKRYLTRKIGFEAVMRIRCTKGLSIHTFHGNFFVRSTDLLSLPNVNPDAGFAVQMSIEDNLVDMQVVSFQAALLYTSSKGERRIRVHTMCLPVVNSLADIFAGADVQAITGLLASMAVDRSVSSSLSDARDALVNAVIDSFSAYRTSVLSLQQPGLLAPACMRLFPLYVLALLKQKAFRTGTSTRLDDRVFAMCQLKYQPLVYFMLLIHPALYRVDNLTDEGSINVNDKVIPQPPILQLSVEKLSRDGAFLMDAGSVMFLWVGGSCAPNFFNQVLGVSDYTAIPQNMTQLPELDTAESVKLRSFISWLREQRPFFPVLHVIRNESPLKTNFMQNMIEDRTESAFSYYEFLLHLQQQVSK
uniref:SEC24 homolog A, COPII coat complex component n=1 Tax=Erpetoichthys calabaricus TaxID=27687 RepID=A0A8C4X909_ERPCA